jgi:hypothetical protein
MTNRHDVANLHKKRTFRAYERGVTFERAVLGSPL